LRFKFIRSQDFYFVLDFFNNVPFLPKMRFHSRTAWAPLLAASAASAYTPASTAQTDLLAGKGLLNLAISEVEAAFSGQKSECTLQNVAVRREWYNLIPPE
jgi:tyrosinase